MKKISIESVKSAAKERKEGYEEAVLSKSKVENNFLYISDEDYRFIHENYNPLAEKYKLEKIKKQEEEKEDLQKKIQMRNEEIKKQRDLQNQKMQENFKKFSPETLELIKKRIQENKKVDEDDN